jgi:hypothetical protein
MGTAKLLVLGVLIITFAKCKSQDTANRFKYTAPFDSLSIDYHKERISWGVGYLLLVKTSNKVEDDFYLVDSRLNEFSDKLSYNGLDSLLNGKVNTLDLNEMIPISSRILALYDKIKICELVEMIFLKDGYYKPPFYLYSSNYILASLIKRGAIITIGDFDGELFIDNKSIKCNYLNLSID